MNAAKELFEEFNNLMRQAEYSGCTKEFVVMVANKIKKEIIPLSQGDSVWYANFETGEIEKGSVVSVRLWTSLNRRILMSSMVRHFLRCGKRLNLPCRWAEIQNTPLC